MINVNEDYKQACESSNRSSYIIAKYGQFDKNVKGKISQVKSNNMQKFSNIYKTYNDIRETTYNYITCEPNRVKLDNSFYFISDKNKSNENEKIAFFNNTLSNEIGEIIKTGGGKGNSIVFNFSKIMLLNDILLHFQEVCKEMKITFGITKNENGSSINTVMTKTITNNEELMVNVEVLEQYKNSSYNYLEINFYKTEEPYRYVKLNEIDFGTFETFTNEQIKDLDIIDELSIDSSELTSNYLSLTIDDTKGEYNLLNPNNKLSLLQEKQEITVYHYLKVANAYKEVPLGTFLLKEFKINKNSLTIEAYDDIYFMNKIYYGSKFYNNEEVKNILQDLFTYFDYTKYIIDDELIGLKLSGYIPIVEFREALRMICEASGCVVNKTRYGETYIFKTYDPSVKTIDERLIFKKNHSRNLFNNVIDIVENTYLEIPNQEVYKATLSVGEHNIIFDSFPILQETLSQDETNVNFIIKEKYATSCVIEVFNETEIVLYATLMKQSTSIKRYKKNTNISFDEYAISKIDNSLITVENSNKIADWKLNRGEIKYNFNTLTIPYIEVGDTCKYQTQFGTINEFIPTRIQFDKSLIQNIEGE